MPGSFPVVVASRLAGFGTTIFAEMSALAAATGAVNLGQGFPDTDGPSELLEAAVDAVRAGHNQYPPGPGIPALRAAIVEHQRRFYGLDYDADAEVLVTVGATEAIAAAMLGLLEPGDEVVMFEPYYDSYAASVAMAGGVRRPVTLHAPDYHWSVDDLRAAVGPRTRMVLLNSPHNPTGKVFTIDELTAVAELAVEHDLLVVADEVYEHLVFSDAGAGAHIPIATLPGMRDRVLTISSAAKTFSVTGWKVGWVCGPPALVDAVRAAKQFLTFVGSGPFQHAVAGALGYDDGFYAALVEGMQAQRDILCEGLRGAGFDVTPPAGTYFVTVDARDVGWDDGMAFCRELPSQCGVVAVPNVVFYDTADAGRPMVRFAFCKRPSVLAEACERLVALGRR